MAFRPTMTSTILSIGRSTSSSGPSSTRPSSPPNVPSLHWSISKGERTDICWTSKLLYSNISRPVGIVNLNWTKAIVWFKQQARIWDCCAKNTDLKISISFNQITKLCWDRHHPWRLETNHAGSHFTGEQSLGWPSSLERRLLPNPQGHDSQWHVSIFVTL